MIFKEFFFAVNTRGYAYSKYVEKRKISGT
jgi:hypothetical protein